MGLFWWRLQATAIHRTLLIEYSALLIEHRDLLMRYGAVLIEYGSLLMEIAGNCNTQDPFDWIWSIRLFLCQTKNGVLQKDYECVSDCVCVSVCVRLCVCECHSHTHSLTHTLTHTQSDTHSQSRWSVMTRIFWCYNVGYLGKNTRLFWERIELVWNSIWVFEGN